LIFLEDTAHHLSVLLL